MQPHLEMAVPAVFLSALHFEMGTNTQKKKIKNYLEDLEFIYKLPSKYWLKSCCIISCTRVGSLNDEEFVKFH